MHHFFTASGGVAWPWSVDPGGAQVENRFPQGGGKSEIEIDFLAHTLFESPPGPPRGSFQIHSQMVPYSILKLPFEHLSSRGFPWATTVGEVWKTGFQTSTLSLQSKWKTMQKEDPAPGLETGNWGLPLIQMENWLSHCMRGCPSWNVTDTSPFGSGGGPHPQSGSLGS